LVLAFTAGCGGLQEYAAPPESDAGVAADREMAAEHSATVGDLPAGWTLIQDEPVTGEGLRPPATCVPSKPGGRRSAGWERGFSYQLSSDGQEAGHLTVTILVQATKEDAAATLALVQDPGYTQCQATRGIAHLSRTTHSSARLEGSSALALPAGLVGRATRGKIAYAYRGEPLVSVQDNYDVIVGRALVRLKFEKCCTGFTEAEEANVVTRTTARFAASPLGA